VPVRVLGVIPARFASSRFPGKALATLAGKPILQHVYEKSKLARYLHEVIIATDDERIATAARGFGATVRMTRSDHPSGTDRVAEVASSSEAQIIVNVQGDEPLIDPGAIDAAVLSLLDDNTVMMGTLMKRIEDPDEITNPNVVKVVTATDGNAIYFSRSPIPYLRDMKAYEELAQNGAAVRSGNPRVSGPFGGADGALCAAYYKHIGLYVYRRNFLLGYSTLPVGPLERSECLEQLRALENGYSIRVTETDYESLGVDTPEDLERVSKLFSMPLNQ